MIHFDYSTMNEQTCDCGLPMSQCLDLGGAGDGDDGSEYPNFVFFESGGEIEDATEEAEAILEIEAIASLGRIIETQTTAIAAYAELISGRFGRTH